MQLLETCYLVMSSAMLLIFSQLLTWNNIILAFVVEVLQ